LKGGDKAGPSDFGGGGKKLWLVVGRMVETTCQRRVAGVQREEHGEARLGRWGRWGGGRGLVKFYLDMVVTIYGVEELIC
jgi:hypothetical protein